MVKGLVLLAALVRSVDATQGMKCDGTTVAADGTTSTVASFTWNAGGTTGSATSTVGYCGQGASQSSWGDLLPYSATPGATVTNPGTGCGSGASQSCAAADIPTCCVVPCSFATWMSGATSTSATNAAASGATKAVRYCGANKVPAANPTTINTGVFSGASGANEDDLGDGQIPYCCQDACEKTGTSPIKYLAGAGTDGTSGNYYCGAGRIPIANQLTTPSGAATNAGAQKTQCCNDACGKVTFKAGEGTDVTTSGSEVYFCGADKVPNENQDSLDSTTDAVGASQKTTCCSDACGKVTFKAGDGTDDSSATTYYCGENKVPVAKQAEKASGSNSVGSGQKTTCCDDACGKVTFKAGKGTDDSASTTYYCGENKVPVAKQKDAPSGSDSVGSGQKSKCCAAACSTVTYKAGEGTDKDTTYFCGKNQAPKKDQKTLPCDGSSCSASGKKDCCAATCASTKWAAGKKPKSPASKTMYCGDGMSPKSALADTVCAGAECAEATDAATCCEKTKVNNTTATTDAQSAGASILVLSGAFVLAMAQ